MRIDRTTVRCLFLLITVALAAVSCGGESEPAVAVVSAIVNRDRVPLGGPIEVTFRFEVLPGAKIDGNYRVMVHFVDSDDELMWTDDHDPPTPTSQWKPGQSIQYPRTLFVPVYPYLGKATVQVGLYDPNNQQRLALGGRDGGQKAYAVATLELLPQSDGIFLVYGDGWHDQEVAQENSAEEWRWTTREAHVSFRNPQRDLVVYLDADARTDVFDSPQQVSLRIGDQAVDTFQIQNAARFLHRTKVSASALGTGEMVELTIAMDKAFVPAEHGGSDRRELGIRVFHVFVEPQ